MLTAGVNLVLNDHPYTWVGQRFYFNHKALRLTERSRNIRPKKGKIMESGMYEYTTEERS
jgi:hypothetical protein